MSYPHVNQLETRLRLDLVEAGFARRLRHRSRSHRLVLRLVALRPMPGVEGRR